MKAAIVYVPIAILFLSVLALATCDGNRQSNLINRKRFAALSSPEAKSIDSDASLLLAPIGKERHGGIAQKPGAFKEIHASASISEPLESSITPRDDQQSSGATVFGSDDSPDSAQQKKKRSKPGKQKRMKRRQALEQSCLSKTNPGSASTLTSIDSSSEPLYGQPSFAIDAADSQDVGKKRSKPNKRQRMQRRERLSQERAAAQTDGLNNVLTEQSRSDASYHDALQNHIGHDETPIQPSRSSDDITSHPLGQKRTKPNKRQRMHRRQRLRQEQERAAVQSDDLKDALISLMALPDLDLRMGLEQYLPDASDYGALQNSIDQDETSIQSTLSSDDFTSHQPFLSSDDLPSGQPNIFEASNQPIRSSDDQPSEQSNTSSANEPPKQPIMSPIDEPFQQPTPSTDGESPQQPNLSSNGESTKSPALSTDDEATKQSNILPSVTISDEESSNASVSRSSPSPFKLFEFSATSMPDCSHSDPHGPLSDCKSSQEHVNSKYVQDRRRRRQLAPRTNALKQKNRAIRHRRRSVTANQEQQELNEQISLLLSALQPPVVVDSYSQSRDGASSSLDFFRNLRFVADHDSGLYVPGNAFHSFSLESKLSNDVNVDGSASFELPPRTSKKRSTEEEELDTLFRSIKRLMFRQPGVSEDTKPALDSDHRSVVVETPISADELESHTTSRTIDQTCNHETSSSTGKHGSSAVITASPADSESQSKFEKEAADDEPQLQTPSSTEKEAATVAVSTKIPDAGFKPETALPAADEGIQEEIMALDQESKQEDVISSVDQQLPADITVERQVLAREAPTDSYVATGSFDEKDLRESGPAAKSLGLNESNTQPSTMENTMVELPDLDEQQSQVNFLQLIWSFWWFKAIILAIILLFAFLLMGFFTRRHILRKRRLSVLDNNIVFVNHHKNGLINMESDQEDNIFSTASHMLRRGGMRINY